VSLSRPVVAGRVKYRGGMHVLTRHRLPLIVLAALFLIPIGTSSLRGLTHLLTCADEVGMPFSIQPGMFEGDPPIVTSSRVLEQGQDPRVCGALVIDLSARAYDEQREAVEMAVAITNASDRPWRGTVQIVLGTRPIPLEVGRIDAGESVVRTVWASASGDRLDVDGTLLIGP
jgi:hypothetical protein